MKLTDRIAQHHGLTGDDANRVGVKAMPAQFKAEKGDTFTAVMSNATIDSDDEVLLPSGAMLKRFDKSGPGYFMHDYSKVPVFVPVGPVEFDGKNLIGKGRWLNNQLAKDAREFVEAMHAEGKSAGVSVGAIYHETRKPTAKDKSMFGEGVKNVVSKWELLELSIAPIQANPEAYTTSAGKRLAKSLFGHLAPKLDDGTAEGVGAAAGLRLDVARAMREHRKMLAIQTAARDAIRSGEIDRAAHKAIVRKRGLLYL